MDTSEQYIKMCEKAEEIQKDWSLSPGDYFYDKSYPKVLILGSDDEANLFSEGITKRIKAQSIYLPCQDRLQEMVRSPSPFHLLEWLNVFIATIDVGTNPLLFTSMEQLWLAFVMKERFGKVWDGEQWIGGGDV